MHSAKAGTAGFFKHQHSLGADGTSDRVCDQDWPGPTIGNEGSHRRSVRSSGSEDLSHGKKADAFPSYRFLADDPDNGSLDFFSATTK
jgi:hypothetical protein